MISDKFLYAFAEFRVFHRLGYFLCYFVFVFHNYNYPGQIFKSGWFILNKIQRHRLPSFINYDAFGRLLA